MTEQEKMEIINHLIRTASTYSETREWIEQFQYFKLLTQRWEDADYILTRTLVWEETYNLEGIMGGYSNVGSSDELIEK